MRQQPYTADGQFDGTDHSRDGQKLEGSCCHNPQLHPRGEGHTYVNRVYTPTLDETVKGTRCWNCGTELDGDGTVLRGQSIPCPNSAYHHIGSACKICGLD